MIHYLLIAAIVAIYAGEVHSQCNGSPELISVSRNVQTLSSPNYPSNYGNNLNCTWILQAPSGGQVEALILPAITEECCDYTTIRDGPSAASSIVVNRKRNASRSLKVISTFGALYIQFFSDETVTAKGFRIQYRQASRHLKCGEDTLVARSEPQYIASPLFGLFNYFSNSYCVWIIRAPTNMQVQLTLIFWEIESCCDNLLVLDGKTDKSPLLTYRSGKSLAPVNYTSTSGVLHVRFRSDSTYNFRGFNASFISVPSVPTTIPVTEFEECGENLQVPPTGHGFVVSPGYNQQHPSNLMCVWLLTTSSENRIRVWFGYISTETCCDWIKVRDGANANSPKIGVISGSPQFFPSYVSSGSILRIEFDSDEVANGKGFNFYYENYKPGNDAQTSTCGAKLTADVNRLQYFSTPNWPGTYDNDTLCIWVITAGFGQTVRLIILGAITEVFSDEIKVYEGDQPIEENRYATLTGKHAERYSFTSSGNQLTVVFDTDENHRNRLQAGGFRASYQAVFDKTSGLLGSLLSR
ncbi:scavenger receptor cysteine-rich domain-containing protein DMBT1-like isoform X3 [Clavelina lepadiformis]|uniref:scavenger receptor cysteine-rich domain-containing protein DMBT1-like isoform X3 n=1 Tax=Clavelina lepadiformis TaxID=159417 RepID=UPI0040432F70